MESRPRFDFMSSMFVVGFGVGAFVGVLLAILAVAFFRGPDRNDPAQQSVILVTATPAPTSSITVTPVVLPRTKANLDVYLGPGEAYAIIGIVSRNTEVAVVGRDSNAQWAAIRFPPESAGRGWAPASQLDGLTGFDRLAVVAPTPLPRNVVPPTTSFPGVDGTGTSVSGTPGPTVTGTVTPRASGTTTAGGPPTATPRPGPSDLLVIGIQQLPDGRVSITLGNRGPGDFVGGFQVLISDNAGHSETLTANAGRVLQVGTTTTLQSSAVVIRGEVEISAFIDPFNALSDPDRSNNGQRSTLSTPPTPTPTPF